MEIAACPPPTCRGQRRKTKPLALQEDGVPRQRGQEGEGRLLNHVNRGQTPQSREMSTPPIGAGACMQSCRTTDGSQGVYCCRV